MSSGTYFPPDVKAVPIPKSGGGTRPGSFIGVANLSSNYRRVF
jgi:retron-type reverse transcriptase